MDNQTEKERNQEKKYVKCVPTKKHKTQYAEKYVQVKKRRKEKENAKKE